MPKRRRRTFTPRFKAQVVLEVLSGERSQAKAARKHKPELIARWKETALEGLETLFRGEEQGDQDQDRVAELERMVGRLKGGSRSLTLRMVVSRMFSDLRLAPRMRRSIAQEGHETLILHRGA